MIITTSETIIGKEIYQTVGLVRGSTVRARNIGRNIFESFKNFVGEKYQNILNSLPMLVNSQFNE